MKDYSMLVWLTQTGISVAAPMAAFVFCAVWLRNQFGAGQWVIWAAIILGIVCAISGLRQSLMLMQQMAERHNKSEEPPMGFNEHF